MEAKSPPFHREHHLPKNSLPEDVWRWPLTCALKRELDQFMEINAIEKNLFVVTEPYMEHIRGLFLRNLGQAGLYTFTVVLLLNTHAPALQFHPKPSSHTLSMHRGMQPPCVKWRMMSTHIQWHSCSVSMYNLAQPGFSNAQIAALHTQ